MGNEILLMDGVRYEPWTLPDEASLAKMVEEHAEDIFGKDSLYFGDLKTRIKSPAGVGSIPDGWAVLLGVPLQAYPVEIELAAHDVYGHISPQVDKISAALQNPVTQQQIVAAIYNEISKDEVLNARAKAKISSNELHKLLSDAISGQPQQLLIVIDSASPQLWECAANKSVPPKIVEFATFCREGVGPAVHIHQFEPLALKGRRADEVKQDVSKPEKEKTSPKVWRVQPSYVTYGSIYIPAGVRHLFPEEKVPFQVEIPDGHDVTTWLIWGGPGKRGISKSGYYISKGMSPWLKGNHDLKGKWVRLDILEPGKRYRISIVEQP